MFRSVLVRWTGVRLPTCGIQMRTAVSKSTDRVSRLLRFNSLCIFGCIKTNNRRKEEGAWKERKSCLELRCSHIHTNMKNFRYRTKSDVTKKLSDILCSVLVFSECAVEEEDETLGEK